MIGRPTKEVVVKKAQEHIAAHPNSNMCVYTCAGYVDYHSLPTYRQFSALLQANRGNPACCYFECLLGNRPIKMFFCIITKSEPEGKAAVQAVQKWASAAFAKYEISYVVLSACGNGKQKHHVILNMYELTTDTPVYMESVLAVRDVAKRLKADTGLECVSMYVYKSGLLQTIHSSSSKEAGVPFKLDTQLGANVADIDTFLEYRKSENYFLVPKSVLFLSWLQEPRRLPAIRPAEGTEDSRMPLFQQRNSMLAPGHVPEYSGLGWKVLHARPKKRFPKSAKYTDEDLLSTPCIVVAKAVMGKLLGALGLHRDLSKRLVTFRQSPTGGIYYFMNFGEACTNNNAGCHQNCVRVILGSLGTDVSCCLKECNQGYHSKTKTLISPKCWDLLFGGFKRRRAGEPTPLHHVPDYSNEDATDPIFVTDSDESLEKEPAMRIHSVTSQDAHSGTGLHHRQPNRKEFDSIENLALTESMQTGSSIDTGLHRQHVIKNIVISNVKNVSVIFKKSHKPRKDAFSKRGKNAENPKCSRRPI
ncbi:uncharacterized protein NEMAJ01_1687 [Nematocida major]|uniref:uncharacterized protein n=1 Tax=Nematocida major TaxID=1912982 RepID=UPI0020086F42|nr:uncharacterized protein NEMAJ01_1687 [Nematocida major]KAH9386791.1 hypothetical protein NEMAJ01_1687 [Nematocida major]